VRKAPDGRPCGFGVVQMPDEDKQHPVPKASIELAAELAESINSSLPKEINIAALGTPSKLPFKVISLRELLLYRIAELSRTAVDLYKSNKVVPAILLTRGTLETTSMLFALDALVRSTLESEDVSSIDETLMKMLVGGRSELAPERAINVLSHIEKMNKKYEGLRWWYEELSEYAHPNYPGLMGSYGIVDEEELMVYLGTNQDTEKASWHFGIAALCSFLEVAIFIYNKMVEPLEAFRLLCHEQANKNSQDAP
jgi:hypothetical protein